HADRVINGMLSIYLAPAFFQQDPAFAAEIQRFIAWVKSSPKVTPGGDILMPGDIEERTKAQRTRDGIDIDPTTWDQLHGADTSAGVSKTRVDQIMGA